MVRINKDRHLQGETKFPFFEEKKTEKRKGEEKTAELWYREFIQIEPKIISW